MRQRLSCNLHECGCTAQVEPDQRAGYCEQCDKNKVVSCLVLADLVFRPNFSLGKAHNRLIRIAFFFARAVDYWTRGSGTPSRAKACSCRTVGRASIWIVRRSPRGSATSLIVSVPS